MRTLYGTYSDNCCGFCKYHHKGITPTQMRRKQCLERHCVHFQKHKQHPHWEKLEYQKSQKEERKELRKQRKADQKAYFEKIQNTAPLTSEFNIANQNTVPEPAPTQDYVLVYSTENPLDIIADDSNKSPDSNFQVNTPPDNN